MSSFGSTYGMHQTDSFQLWLVHKCMPIQQNLSECKRRKVRKLHLQRKQFEFFLSQFQTKRGRKKKEKNSQKTQRSLFIFQSRKMHSDTNDTTNDSNNNYVQMLNLLHELYTKGKLLAASYEGYRQRVINSALGPKKRKKPQCKWCSQYMEGHIDELCPRGKVRKRNAAATPRSEDPMRGARSPAPPPITTNSIRFCLSAFFWIRFY